MHSMSCVALVINVLTRAASKQPKKQSKYSISISYPRNFLPAPAAAAVAVDNYPYGSPYPLPHPGY
uniref:Uncharacterized protein n=1 Tax=Rhizophora mucronata TaxID=61149 RepID=A0A2P2Q8W9_RHIMU